MKNYITDAYSTNIFYEEIKPIINCFRFFGVIFLDENHSWSTYSKTKSRLIGFYTSIVLTATTILAAVLVKEHVDIILHGEITFDDSIFFYGTTFFYVSCQIVPFFTFLEKKKINNFFRLWRHFEVTKQLAERLI